MFAYCLNNPVVFADTHGTDACVVIDNDQAWGFGHICFFAQDDEGTWWHFYWGPEDPYLPIIGINVEPVTWLKEYEGDISLEAINASGQYSRTYHRMIYLFGDFSDCIEQATNLDSQYNLYFENCSQVSLSILASANTPHKNRLESAAKKTIPKRAFKFIEESCVSPAYNGSTGVSGRNLFYTKY